jgi:hypothetical protein
MTNPGGRPTVMTPEVIGKLEYAFSIGCTDIEACFFADISKDALYDYQLKNPSFTTRKEALKSNPILKARESVFNKLSDDADLSLKFLERKCRDEFSLKQENTHQGVENGVPISTSLKVEFVKSDK